ESEPLLNDARNKLSSAIIEFEITRELIRIIPQALAEAVKPIEKISDIRIFDTGGMIVCVGAAVDVAGFAGAEAGVA
ncbi:flotillin domain-containing protein, partial [Rhizobium leguminosarum]|uniref:flotillin domain-containing protein n=1 Tax=Rhizobium leguminosarum TaxID=384 RepID=UPI003F9B7110